MQGQLTIQFENMEELRQELTQLLGNLPVPVIQPHPEDVAKIHAALAATGAVQTTGGYPAVSGISGPKVHPPEDRARLNEAAAKAHEALAQQRANGKPPEAATPVAAVKPVETAARKRGRPARAQAPAQAAGQPPASGGNGVSATRPATEPGEDLAGDPEEGDHAHTPEEEPSDPLAADHGPPKTPAELRSALLPVLMEVHKKDKAAVPALCAKFKAARVSLIDDRHVDQLWEDSMILCRKHGVPFVGEDPGGDAML